MNLTPSQHNAIAHVAQYCKPRLDSARKTIEEVLLMSDIDPGVFDAAIQNLKQHASVAVHFHPDRITGNGQTVIASLMARGKYQNQFESKISNGRLAPHRGGARDAWEQAMFGDAYLGEDIALIERAKYGALDIMRFGDGPCPRFGSCYFILHPAVTARSTFTYLDSYKTPESRGTMDYFDDILASLLAECFERNDVLGARDIHPRALVRKMAALGEGQFLDLGTMRPSRNLNQYIEAQVHGDILLAHDVKFLVADPSFKQSEAGTMMQALCDKYDIELRWHMGFQMDVADVPTDFRGATMPSLARRIAQNGRIDARIIGNAARDVVVNPGLWEGSGTAEQCLQELKLLWHVLVRYGQLVL